MAASSKKIEAGRAFVTIFGDKNPLTKTLGTIQADLSKTAQSIGRMGVGMIGAAAAGAAALAWPVKLADDLDNTRNAFETMLGSAAAADQMIADIRTIKVPGAAEAAQTMLGFNVEAGKIIPSLRAIADITGGNQQRFESLSLAFAQSAAAGRLMGQDLLQMINAGFNPLQEISRKTGESITDLKKRMEAGGISFAEVESAFASATAAGGKFFGMMQKRAGTISGIMGQMRVAIEQAVIPIGQALMPALKSVGQAALVVVPIFAELIKQNIHLVPVVAGSIGALGAAGAAMITLAGAIKLVSFALTPIGLLLGPFVGMAKLAPAVAAGFLRIGAATKSLQMLAMPLQAVSGSLKLLASTMVSTVNAGVGLTAWAIRTAPAIGAMAAASGKAAGTMLAGLGKAGSTMLSATGKAASQMLSATSKAASQAVSLARGGAAAAASGVMSVVGSLASGTASAMATMGKAAGQSLGFLVSASSKAFGQIAQASAVSFAALARVTKQANLLALSFLKVAAASAFSALTNPWTLLGAVIAGVGYAVYRMVGGLDGLRAAWGSAFAGMQGIIGQFGAAFSTFSSQFMQRASAAFTAVKEVGMKVWSAISDAVAAGDIQAAINVALAAVKLAWVATKDFLTNVWNDLASSMASPFANAVAEMQFTWAAFGSYVEESFRGAMEAVLGLMTRAQNAIARKLIELNPTLSSQERADQLQALEGDQQRTAEMALAESAAKREAREKALTDRLAAIEAERVKRIADIKAKAGGGSSLVSVQQMQAKQDLADAIAAAAKAKAAFEAAQQAAGNVPPVTMPQVDLQPIELPPIEAPEMKTDLDTDKPRNQIKEQGRSFFSAAVARMQSAFGPNINPEAMRIKRVATEEEKLHALLAQGKQAFKGWGKATQEVIDGTADKAAELNQAIKSIGPQANAIQQQIDSIRSGMKSINPTLKTASQQKAEHPDVPVLEGISTTLKRIERKSGTAVFA